MKKTTAVLAALAMGAVSALAGTAPPPPTGKNPPPPPPADPCAGPISYNNIELLYAYTDFDGGGDDGNGFELNLEYAPAQNFFLTAGVEYIDANDSDAWLVHLGIGGSFALSPNIHLVADGGALWGDVNFNGPVVNPLPGGSGNDGDDDDWGWYIRPHLRAKWGCLTVHLGAEYRDIFNAEEWSGYAKFYYQVHPAWDLTAGVSFGEHETQATAGVRFRY